MLSKIPAPILKWLAIGLLALYPLAILAARLGMHFSNSFLIFIVAALLGFIVLVLAVLKLPKKKDDESQPLIIAIVLTLAPLMLLGNNIVTAKSVPFIHDISTDTQNPPVFVAAKEARTAGDHAVEYKGEEIAKLQKAGYPNLTTVELDETPENALTKTKQIAQQMGWQVLAVNDQQPPYTLEAVDTSLLFGFEDDIVVRLTPFTTPEQNVDVPPKTKVDVRSMSRVGKSDLGANAQRIEAFLTYLQQAN